MRLLSATVRHYRVHQELTVHFTPELNLIGGPNESGKSTFVEAIHRALFLRAKSTGDVQKSMVSRHLDAAHPEVEVNFESGGVAWSLFKRFSGASGSARLQRADGRETLHDDEAEERLHHLLQVEMVGKGRGIGERLTQQWGHLWVWQGKSGDDPCSQSGTEHPRLLQKLQETGGTAALLSPADTRLAEAFAAQRQAIFQQSGKPKKGSDYERAETELEASQTALTAARQRITEREQAMARFEAADRRLAEIQSSEETLRRERAENDARRRAITQLTQTEKAHQQSAEEAQRQLATLRQLDTQIATLHQREGELQASLRPRQARLASVFTAHAAAREALDQRTPQLAAAREATRRTRRHLELVRAALASFEAQKQLAEAEEKARRIAAARAEKEAIAKKIAELPSLTERDLNALRDLASKKKEAEAALQAMAVGIVLESADGPVTLDGRPLEVATEKTVTEQTEICAGGLRLVIRPGGGARLDEARREHEAAGRALTARLDQHGVASLAQAIEAVSRRALLAADLKETEGTLKHLGATAFDQQLSDLRLAAEKARAEVERRQVDLTAEASPADAEAARTALTSLQVDLERLEAVEREHEIQREAEDTRRQKLEKDRETAQQAVLDEQQQLQTCSAQLQLLRAQNGDDTQRREQLISAETTASARAAALEKVRADLRALDPGGCERDALRLERATHQNLENRETANRDKAMAEGQLRSEGEEDPLAALAEAEARLALATARQAHAKRHAEAIRLLDDLITAEQRALSEQFTRPLAEKISEYLTSLFGPGARAEVSLEDNSFTGIRLLRGTANVDLFTDLSGGAREQVAAAVRLAVAELLATDHDGCLPVVFDDAFAFSDPERVRSLQRMLDLAAGRGLQLLILSCTPSDYATLGAKTQILSA